jgi:hypothetical protein
LLRLRGGGNGEASEVVAREGSASGGLEGPLVFGRVWVPYPETPFAKKLVDDLDLSLRESPLFQNIAMLSPRGETSLEQILAGFSPLLTREETMRRGIPLMWMHGGIDLENTLREAIELGVGGGAVQAALSLLLAFDELFPPDSGPVVPEDIWYSFMETRRPDLRRWPETERRFREQAGIITVGCVPREWARALTLWSMPGSMESEARAQEPIAYMTVLGRGRMLPLPVIAVQTGAVSELHALKDIVEVTREIGCQVDDESMDDEGALAWDVMHGHAQLPPEPDLGPNALPGPRDEGEVEKEVKRLAEWYLNAPADAGLVRGNDPVWEFEIVGEQPSGGGAEIDLSSEPFGPTVARDVRTEEVEEEELEGDRWDCFRQMDLQDTKWHFMGLVSDCCVVLDFPPDMAAYRVLYQLLPQWRSPGVYQTRLPWKAKVPVFMRGVVEALHDEIEPETVDLESFKGSAVVQKVQSILGKRGRERE